MACTGIFSWLCIDVLGWIPKGPKLDLRGNLTIYAFSFIFNINIVAGNLSIQYVSVSFLQIFRAIIPGITMVLSFLILGKSTGMKQILSIIPICFGVILTVRGEIELTVLGLIITAVGTFLSSLKVVLTNKFLVGTYKLNPLDLLLRIAPAAFLQMVVMIYFMEYDRLKEHYDELVNINVLSLIFLSGIMACLLNVTNFYANLKTSPVALTVGGNVKQVLTIILSILIFKNVVSTMGAVGMFITIIGAICYQQAK
eukprot:TRINITY_DN1791_c0_g1_i2.p1 TRINITY_DN1791_c0_g1~~TRINITY_DN1791_c0_g1_i2.p1  ORF type:complete len:255 (-),score=30.40 TRINITY_DN1791_c0_g1_i2:43-807(-)